MAPSAEVRLANFEHTIEFSLGAAGLIGTVLVLTFTLSMIPVQRAAEGMPVSVVRLLARDWVNAFLFVALALLCLSSFSLALYDGFGLRPQLVLPVQLLLIGITFDLVRWHHRHTLGLLEPVRGVESLLSQAIRLVRSVDRRVRITGTVQWLLIPHASRRLASKDQLLAALYRRVPAHAAAINQWTRELEEAALRSVEQGETRVAVAAIDSMALIGSMYLATRRHTLTPILASPLGVYDSNLRDVLTPTYESLIRVAQSATATKREPIVIRVVQGLGRLAMACATLKSRAFREHTAPLTGMPLAYLERCALPAVASGLHDTGLEASKALASVSINAPENTDIADVHIGVADGILHIVAGLFMRQQGALVNMCVEDCLRTVWQVVLSRHFEADRYVQHVLGELSVLIPVAAVSEATSGRNLMATPLGPVYDLSNELAMAYLLARVEEADRTNERYPYVRLSKLGEQFHRHLREIAENVDFKNSSLVWHIVKTIECMAQVYQVMVMNASAEHGQEARQLAQKQLPWFLAFTWVHFSKAESIDLQTACQATESLASIAFTYMNVGIAEIVDSAISNIGSVTRAYGKLGKLRSQYDIGDLLRPLLCVERFAIAVGDQILIAQIDHEVDEVMKLFQDDVRAAVGEAIDTRRSQIEDALTENWSRIIERDSPEGMLSRMLDERHLLP